MDLQSLLKPINVELDNLLLDPNNPRFSELGEQLNTIAEARYAEPKVQDSALEKMKNPLFDVGELRDTIKTIGFLPMDRVVVRKWKGRASDGKQKYVVIEGNRRVTALKWLNSLHDIGKETFDERQLSNFRNLEALELNTELAPPSATLILPGLRHVSGVKEWGPYQKAKAVHALRKSGLPPQEAAQSLGLSTRAANNAYRCFLALEQMKEDEEFGESAQPKMYSYFEEVFKETAVRNWLNWSEEKEKFSNSDNVKEFYSWIVPRGEDGESAKLSEAKSVRSLSQIITDEAALTILRSAEGTLPRALARYEMDHPEDWYPKLIAANTAIKSLTPDMLRSMDDTTLQALRDLLQRIQQALHDRERLSDTSKP